MINKIKLFCIDFLIFIAFFVVSVLVSAFFVYYKVKDYNLINLIAYFICFVFLYIIYKKEFKKYISDFKKNYKKYLSKYLFLGIVGLIFMNILSSVIASYIGNLPANENAIRSTLKDSNIIVLFLNIGIMTPICEETVFRLNFRNLFNNKYLFSLLTGLLFGSVHLIASGYSIELLYIIPYGFIGCLLSYIYADSDNLFNSIIIHMINNIGTLALIMAVGS